MNDDERATKRQRREEFQVEAAEIARLQAALDARKTALAAAKANFEKLEDALLKTLQVLDAVRLTKQSLDRGLAGITVTDKVLVDTALLFKRVELDLDTIRDFIQHKIGDGPPSPRIG